MDVTVAICTWNRAQLLEQTLASLERLRVAVGLSWELLVVDNNSTDPTAEVIQRFTDRLPLVPLFEPKQGLSNARNCAVAKTRGEVLIWTDDDVLVDENWLAAYAAAAARWPEAGFFAGRIDPLFVEPPPKHFCNHPGLLKEITITCNLGSDERLMSRGEYPYGANMAIRVSALHGRRYDPELGRKGHGMLGAEESEVIRDLHEQGVSGVWVPNAIVQHYVEPKRLTPEFAWRFHEGWGRTLVRLHGRAEGQLFRGAPRWMHRRYWETLFASYWQRLWRDPKWFKTYTKAAEWRGQILENRVQRATKGQAGELGVRDVQQAPA